MNRYQEALDELSFPLDDSSCGGCKCGASDCQDCKKAQAVFKLQELVEKATPKKPIGDLHSVPHYRCPKCKKAVVVYEDGAKLPFCHWCGQALDWSEEDVK